jgi:hypothetical protein
MPAHVIVGNNDGVLPSAELACFISMPRLQVFNNVQLMDSLKPLHTHGVKDGDLLVMLGKRTEPPPQAAEPGPFPSADDVARAVRAEGERQGQDVTEAPAATTTGRQGRARMEAQLQEVMEVGSRIQAACFSDVAVSSQ